MRRFYVPKKRWQGKKALLDSDQCRHLTRVLRMGIGDTIIIFDGKGEFEAIVESVVESRQGVIDKSGAWCRIVRPVKDRPAKKAHIILAPAIIKAKKMNLVIEKATELGADEIIPFTSARCVIKPKPGKSGRWIKIAESAAAQSGQTDVPKIHEPVDFKKILQQKADLKIMLWEGERNYDKDPIKTVGATRESPLPTILLLAGPEGGFTDEEVRSATDAGFVTWGITPSTLRAETASIAGLAILVNHALA